MFQHAPPISERHPLAMLYQHHASAIFDYARRQLPSVEDAEDVLVEVFLAALEQPAFFGLSEQEQHAWLWRMARNKIVDIYRRRGRQRQIPLGEAHQSLVDEQGNNPEQISLEHERTARTAAQRGKKPRRRGLLAQATPVPPPTLPPARLPRSAMARWSPPSPPGTARSSLPPGSQGSIPGIPLPPRWPISPCSIHFRLPLAHREQPRSGSSPWMPATPATFCGTTSTNHAGWLPYASRASGWKQPLVSWIDARQLNVL